MDTSESLKKEADKIEDLTQGHKSPHSLSFTFFLLEINIARYALTMLSKKFGECSVADATAWGDAPSSWTVETSNGKWTKVYNNVIIYTQKGVCSGIYYARDKYYRVELLADTPEKLKELKDMFTNCLENSNFYKGNCVKFLKNGLAFMPIPKRTFNDVIISDKIMAEYSTTVIDFLSDEKMQEICKKRRVLLYGPPGTGKTSLISATFNDLTKKGITCVSLNEIISMEMSVEEVFDFILHYLAPAFIVFEDIDLFGIDRDIGVSPIIGKLLAIYDGVEDIKKAVVMCSTTNRAEILDKAFVRPCRVDRKFCLETLNDEGMNNLFKLLLNIPLPKELVGQKLTGSHIQEIADSAKLLAKKAGKDPKEYVDEAVKTVMEHFQIIQSKTVGFGMETSDLIEEDKPSKEATGDPWKR